MRVYKRQSWGFGVRDPRFWDGGRGVSVKYYYVSYNVGLQEIKKRWDENTFQRGDFSEIWKDLYILNKIPGMILSSL